MAQLGTSLRLVKKTGSLLVTVSLLLIAAGLLDGGSFTSSVDAADSISIAGVFNQYQVNPSTSDQTITASVSLFRKPSNSVTVKSSLDGTVAGIAVKSGASLVFTPDNYSVSQSLVITIASTVTAGKTSILTLQGSGITTQTSSIQVVSVTGTTPTAPVQGGYNISLPFSGTTHYDNFSDYFVALMKWAVSIAGILAILVILWGAFKYTTSGGDQAKAKEGKDIIVGALVGFALLLLIRILIPIIGI